MSKLRPETIDSPDPVIERSQALRLIYRAVAKRRSLAHGVLDDPKTGKHCALGCFWEDYNGALNTSLIDEVAAVNDSVPPDASPKERWVHVMRWLRYQINR